MAMRACERCLENVWDSEYDDESGYVTATCRLCGYEVSFPTRRAGKKERGDDIGDGVGCTYEHVDGLQTLDGSPYVFRINDKGHIWVAREGTRRAREGTKLSRWRMQMLMENPHLETRLSAESGQPRRYLSEVV